MTLTQPMLDRAALVVVAGDDGLVEWSSTKSREDVASYLECLAAAIRAGAL